MGSTQRKVAPGERVVQLPAVMRFAFLRLLPIFLLVGVAAAPAGEAEFVRIWPRWQEADSFDRIHQFFGGSENTARHVVLRTTPETREGFYFFVRVKSAAAPAGAKFELSVIRSDGPEAKVFTFPAALPAGETVFQLGLTGAAWPGGKKASPVAWRLALLAGDGRLLAERKSFLWE